MTRIKFIVENDMILRLFGMSLEEAEEGYARLSATIDEKSMNAHSIAHGALIFALADVAFAISVNSITDAVGVQWSMNCFRAAKLGETLTAESRLIHRGSSVMVVDFRVANQEGKLVASGQATALPVNKEKFRS